MDDTLCYQVDKITVVEPEETEALAVEKGMDLVTLLTCTPYGVNSHRLLVRGHRVPYNPESLVEEKVPLGNVSLHTSYLLWVVVGLLVTALFCFFLYKRERRIERANRRTEGTERIDVMLEETVPQESEEGGKVSSDADGEAGS